MNQRIAIVGLGEAGATLHYPALKRVPTATIVGACDTEPSRREAFAKRAQVPVFDDFDVMIRSVHPDVVSVASPPASHASLCLKALAAGADVFCEKPFVCSLGEADEVIAAASASGRLVAVNHEFREMPIFRAVIDEVRQGKEGELLFAQSWQQIDLPPWREHGWRGSLIRRTLFEAGVHQIDLLLALFDETPQAVQARMSSAGLDPQNRDAIVVVVLEFSRGRLAVLIQNRLTKGEPQYFEVRADVERAAYRASFGGRARVSAGMFRSSRPHVRVEYGRSGIAWRESGTRRQLLARNPSLPNVDATRRLIAQALEAFRSRQAPRSGAAEAREVMTVVEACYTSAETGRRIVIGS